MYFFNIHILISPNMFIKKLMNFIYLLKATKISLGHVFVCLFFNNFLRAKFLSKESLFKKTNFLVRI